MWGLFVPVFGIISVIPKTFSESEKEFHHFSPAVYTINLALSDHLKQQLSAQ